MVVKYCRVNEKPYIYEARYYIGKNEYYEYKMCRSIQEVKEYASKKYCKIRRVFRFKYQRL